MGSGGPDEAGKQAAAGANAETFGKRDWDDPAAAGDVEVGVDVPETWPMIHPPAKRGAKYNCCCCPGFPLVMMLVAVFAWAVGFVVLAVAGAVALCLYACCGYPLVMGRIWLKTWKNSSWDYHSTLYVQLLMLAYQAMAKTKPGTGPEDMPVSALKPKKQLQKKAVEFSVSIEVPVAEEEEFLHKVPILDPLVAILETKFTSTASMEDDFTPFKPGEDPVKYCMRQIGHIYPTFNDAWEDKQSDRALTRFCLHGLAAHRVERTELNGAPHYVVRCNVLSKLPVRKGYARYGGDAYFDMNWRAVQIVDSGAGELRPDGLFDTKTTKPGEKAWNEAKFRFRSSLSVLVTLIDHLYGTHLQMANLFVTALREQMSPEHPVRRFLTPFTYHTITVNHNARNNLIDIASLGPRCFGFTDVGITTAFAAARKLLVFGYEVPKDQGGPILDRTKHYDWLKKKGVDTMYHRQNAQITQIFRNFVTGYLAYYYPTSHDLLYDKELEMFVQYYFNRLECVDKADLDMPIHHPYIRPAEATGEEVREFLVTLLAEFMWTVTAGHEQVGNLSPYVQDVSFCSFRWVPGATVGTKQTATNQATLMSFTSTPMPELMGTSWTHLFPEKASPPPGCKTPVEVFKSFQEELEAMAKQCDEYNAKASERPFPDCFPLYTCHPRYLEMSISV